MNVEDIFLLLVFLYSLTGQECFNSPLEEEQMKVRLYEKINVFCPLLGSGFTNRELNPLNPNIKIQILICYPYTSSIKVVGRIC